MKKPAARRATSSPLANRLVEDLNPTGAQSPPASNGHESDGDGRRKGPFHKHTDLGNAERLADLAYGKVLWVHGLGWLWWDGKRWKRDESKRVLRIATNTVRSIYQEAEFFNGRAALATDEEERNRWGKLAEAANRWATASESAGKITATIKLAAAQPLLVLDEGAKGLDANPMALNVQNGILDLDTLELRPHDPAERHTRIAGASYDPEAEAPFFQECMKRALPDEELRRWVQKAVGYSLPGTHSEFLFIPHGDGANLKSTVEYAWRRALGDYAAEAPSDLLVARREWGAAGESALAGLHGRRFVTATETEQGKQLAEVLAKKLTGEPEITAKFMRQNYFTYPNQMAVWLATNYKPVVQGTDLAIWRRIRLIPFEVTIPPEERIDPSEVQRRLREERDGILAWMVEGLRLYQEEGLSPEPEAVAAATRGYREEMDPLAGWLREAFDEDPEAVVSIEWLRKSYRRWAESTGRFALGERRFNELMGQRGFTRPASAIWFDVPSDDGGTERKRMKAWKGLRPKDIS